jgi:hypothetical protein
LKGHILIAHIIYTSRISEDIKTFAFQEHYEVWKYWHFRDVTRYESTGISGMLQGTKVLAFQGRYKVRKYWYFRDVTRYGSTGISGTLQGTEILAFLGRSKVLKY